MVAEASYQLDWLHAAIYQAKRQVKDNSIRRARVIFMCGVDESVARKHRRYTVAMYLRHLGSLLRSCSTVAEVVAILESRVAPTPASNTGVNSDGQGNEPTVTVVSHGR